MNRFAVYTAIAGGYDGLREHPEVPGVDWHAFTEEPDHGLRPDWTHHDISQWWNGDVGLGAHPRTRAKWFKVHSSQVLPEYDRTLWIDGSVDFTAKGARFIQKVLARVATDAPIMLCSHPNRHCIYEEAVASLPMLKYEDQPLLEQIAAYKAAGHPPGWGLWACGIIGRRNTPQLAELERRWWAEIRRWSYQDQVSLPVVLRAMQIQPTEIPVPMYSGEFFDLHMQPAAP